ncbi:glycerol-3-phosphate dehydrogenase/oxidase [Gemmatimonas aurantiaca]|uniref:glycerol-3-phosphate dehydrogenase/oxidase n=1 Tax=Gemmatimonas aurantiaca TaxID=173480 RepID=UPI00301DCB55
MEPVPGWREAAMAALASEPFDILIIGGGITGAGVAREAALAGYRTALLERDDFAAGTSSRSSRLVHGGVRYLEHGHLGLVFESSRERRLLLSLAPHLVRPLAFTWPVYRGARVPRWKVRAGLLLYDALALFRNVHRHEGLDTQGVLSYEPALDRQALVGGARYWDAATDDSRLTLANAQGAADAGAVVLNHCGVVAGLHEGSRLVGVTAEDALTEARFDVRARVVINATGPWSDATSALTGTAQGAQVFGSAGAHVAVPRQRIGNRDALTIVSPLDGRVMFVLPAGAHAIIGTTEQPARRGPDTIRATVADVTYLLQSINRVFPFAQLSLDDVISAWCGIRPLALARAGEHNANAASREHAITTRSDGQLSVTGGKLTTYRAMAADILRHARQALGESHAGAHLEMEQRSRTTPLPGGDITSREAVAAEASGTVRDVAVGERLAQAYGSRWRNVWSYVQRTPALGNRISDDLPYLAAEVAHAIEREWACTFADVLVRRTHLAFETRNHGHTAARRIAPIMQTLLGWSDAELDRQLAAYDADITRLFTIDEMS